jgi:hypothetical protein
MVFDHSERQPLVGDDVVEMREQVDLGHGWQARQVILCHVLDLEAGQSLPVPGRPLARDLHQRSKPAVALGDDLIGGPVEPRDVAGKPGHRVGEMPLAKLLVCGHGDHRLLRRVRARIQPRTGAADIGVR